jgi:hypothetical protein
MRISSGALALAMRGYVGFLSIPPTGAIEDG